MAYHSDHYQNEISELVREALDEGYSLVQIALVLSRVMTYFLEQEVNE